MMIKMADDSKCFQALLNGLVKRNYFGNSELTDEFLKKEIYPDINQEDFNRINTKCTALLKNLVSADMDMTQLEAFLTAQMRRKDATLTEQQAAVLRKFWKANKSKIHDSIVSQTMWGNTLQKVSWRVDLKCQSRNIEQIQTPSTIMELHIVDNLNKELGAEIVRFELDEDKVNEVLANLQEIESQISKHSKQ